MDFCGVRVRSKYFLAPMAAVTNLPFRMLCVQKGAGMVFTEQINATQIARNPDPFTNNEFSIIKTCDEEKPVAVQLFGVNEEDFAVAAKAVESNFEMININCGCPSYKEVSIGAGAALLKKPEKIGSIVKAIKSKVSKPVTVKIRLGWDKDESIKICRILEKSGVDGIIVHGRTAIQGYSGIADWDAIARIRQAVEVPVVANGDVNSCENAVRILEKTGADFAMIGRQAMINPLIFDFIHKYVVSGKEPRFSPKEKIKLFYDYYELCKKFEMVKLEHLRLNAMRLTKSIPMAKKLRVKMTLAKSINDILPELDAFFTESQMNFG
jgi:tRNA-dihydrouridine synthase B